MNKDEVRKLMINKRKDILNKKELSKIIIDKVISLDIYKDARVVAIYNSLKDEVDTTYLINEALSNKIVLLPSIINNEMVFIKINSNTKYNKGNLGILEPSGRVYLDNIDIMIVPGISFDRRGNRLGFGMGYYDKYLSNKDIYKIGICFNDQIIDLVPHNELDIKMDMVITENRVYKKDLNGLFNYY